MHVTRIIHHARQLLTLAAPPGGGPRRGAQMAEIGLIEDGALALKGEVMSPSAPLRRSWPTTPRMS